MIRKNLLLLVTLLSGPLLMAQTATTFNFAVNAASGYNTNPTQMRVDSEGNFILAGHYRNTIDVDPGPGVHYLTSTNTLDIYLIKFSPAGELIWAHSFGDLERNDLETTEDRCEGLYLDENDNIYISGSFAGDVDFDPDPSNEYFLSQSTVTYNNGYTHTEVDAYVASFSNDGDFRWAKSYGSKNGQDKSYSIDGADGSLYTVGATSALDGSYLEDNFIWKLDTDGNEIWFKTFEDKKKSHGLLEEDYDRAEIVKVDPSGDLYIYGFFNDSVDFSPGVGEYYLYDDYRDAYLAKLNADGELIYAKALGVTTREADLETASDGSVYLFHKETITKFDNLGNTLWSAQFQNISSTTKVDFKVNAKQELIFTIDNLKSGSQLVLPGETVSLSDIDGLPMSYIRLSSEGEALLVDRINGEQRYNPYSFTTRDMVILSDGGVAVMGNFFEDMGYYSLAEGKVDTLDYFMNDDLVLGSDLYLASISECSHSYNNDTIVVSSCDAYIGLSGKVYYQDGIYVDTSYNAQGCDSISFINYTYTGIKDTVYVEACESYTWLNGVTYTSSTFGPEWYILRDDSTCDQVIVLDLTIYKPKGGTDNVLLCPGDSIQWKDDNYYTIGETASVILESAKGCDSTVTLKITDVTVPTRERYNLCEGDSMLWRDNNYHKPYTHIEEYTYTNDQGCISTVELEIFKELKQEGLDPYVYNTNSLYLDYRNAQKFTWFNCYTDEAIEGLDSYNEEDVPDGAYYVVFEHRGCVDTSNCALVGVITAKEKEEAVIAETFPNPVKTTLTVRSPEDIISLTVFNEYGIVTDQIENIKSKEYQLNVNDLQTGVYFLQINTNNTISVTNFIKQ